MRVDGKVAIVTGGGRGIGKAICERLSVEGADVVVVDLDASTAAATAQNLSDTGKHLALDCDVSDSRRVKQVFEDVREKYGRIDIMVNNAALGVAPKDGSEENFALIQKIAEQRKNREEKISHPDQTIFMEDEGWQRVIDITLSGVFYFCREAIRLMIEADVQGSIVNISSTGALSGEGAVHYVAAKGGIISLSRALARELSSRRIRVNTVLPGPTDTPAMRNMIPAEWMRQMERATPLGRLGTSEEVANMVVFLASDEASYMTGCQFAANGGSYFL